MMLQKKWSGMCLVLIMLVGIFSNPVSVQAATYSHITEMIDGEGNDIPYFPQVNSGDCGISSIAMIEAEALGYNKTWFQAFYEGVFQANIKSGSSPSFSISKVLNGYTSIKESSDSATMANMYNALKEGKPVLVYRTGGKGDHWSVVVAYKGSTSSLQKSGFIVYNTMHGVAAGDVQSTDLATWLSGATWKYAYIRDEGAMSSVTKGVRTMSLENLYYPKNLKKGSTFSSTGLLISGSDITRIEVGVKNSSGTILFRGFKTDLGRNYYGLMNFDKKMSFSTLSAGTYYYYIKATNEGGSKLNWSKAFTVSSNSLTFAKTTLGEIVPTKVTLNKSSAKLTKVGQTVSLTATVSPSNATYSNVTWKSSNTSVATVSSSGVVKAVGNGTATITATTYSGKKTATCKVTVSIAPTGVKLDKTNVTLTKKGEAVTLKATVNPSSAANKNVTWKSSDTSVATVSSSGKITAVGNGTATITVTTKVGSKTATCKVTVDIKNGLYEGEDGNLYYYKDGEIYDTFTGLVEKESDEWYYVENGKVDFTYDGVAPNAKGALYYVENSKVDFGKSGIYKRSGKYYYFKAGKVQVTDTIIKHTNGNWYAVFDGIVDFTYDGIASNGKNTYYIENGKVDFTKEGIHKRSGNFYYFKAGKVQFVDTIIKHTNGNWYAVWDGVVDFNFKGIASNSRGMYYCQKGKVNFNFTGTVEYEGKTYKVVKGKATLVK